MLNIYGYINHTGYGQHCKNFTIALSKVYPDICLNPISGIQDKLFQDEADVIYSLIAKQRDFSFSDPCMVINMAGFLQYGAGNPRIGFPVFETTMFTPNALNQLNQLDFIFVPTKWAKKIISASAIATPTYVIHEGINPDVFNKDVSPHPFYSFSDYFTFINVGKYEPRKSQFELINAFDKAFGGKKNKVQLLLHAMTPFIPNWKEEIIKQVVRLGYKPQDTEKQIMIPERQEIIILEKGNVRILINTRLMMSAAEMASLYRSCDCGIFPGKAEGWDLPLMECMAVGIPCIATNWSGHTEFANDNNCFLIKDGVRQIANDGLFFKGDVGSWTSPDENEMAAIMNKISGDYSEAQSIGLKAANEIAEEFTWDNAALQASEILEEIL